jgi:hypothetical protein
MTRISIILTVALLCILNARAPDPRVVSALDALSHTHQISDESDGSFYCPMDPDVRSIQPGNCPRCGMKLVEGSADILEYPLDLALQPATPRPGELTRLVFGVVDPRTSQPVRNFEIVHEQLYHVFMVSQDLSFFVHTHPDRQAGEPFHLDVRFPKPGMYRVLSDFYPAGGTPQLITSTVMVPGAGFSLAQQRTPIDMSPKATENSRAEMSVLPSRPIAGQQTSLRVRVSPNDGIEPYLGAWGHMLAVSADLIDMLHQHPAAAVDARIQSYKELQFNMIFPRPGVYRVWAQFQRLGVVNTVAFDVPVDEGGR